jgi:hypothetical protein
LLEQDQMTPRSDVQTRLRGRYPRYARRSLPFWIRYLADYVKANFWWIRWDPDAEKRCTSALTDGYLGVVTLPDIPPPQGRLVRSSSF